MKTKMPISLHGWRKALIGTQTLSSATVYPRVDDLLLTDNELSDEQLSNVVGGMMPDRFELWRTETVNSWREVNGA